MLQRDLHVCGSSSYVDLLVIFHYQVAENGKHLEVELFHGDTPSGILVLAATEGTVQYERKADAKEDLVEELQPVSSSGTKKLAVTIEVCAFPPQNRNKYGAGR